MADFSSKIGNFIGNFNPDPKKAGKILLVLNVLGMISAAVTNTFAAAVDKNTSAKDKKFLVPAGAVTGFANIGIYYAMTDKIIDKLKESVNPIIENMKKDGSLDTKAKELALKTIDKAEKGFMGTGLFKKQDDIVQSMKQNLFENGDTSKNITEAARTLYKDSTTAAAGVAGAFFGAVVGCAILTPIIRDVSAYLIQKVREKNNPELKEQPYKPYFQPTTLDSSRYGKKQPLSMKSYMAQTGGSNLKI
ncbi:MAG: hypothetical protein E7Z88_02400 [Cyanobacteria bacterium SIG27]|nr:hypothetical protein [Cyanobacteria bacterium SIG27]